MKSKLFKVVYVVVILLAIGSVLDDFHVFDPIKEQIKKELSVTTQIEKQLDELFSY